MRKTSRVLKHLAGVALSPAGWPGECTGAAVFDKITSRGRGQRDTADRAEDPVQLMSVRPAAAPAAVEAVLEPIRRRPPKRRFT
jgi:hypothetical protein